MFGYLAELLLENNTVILPDFGAFTISDPKKRELMFMPYLRYDDGKMVGYIAERKQISLKEARGLVINFVKEIQIILDSGEPFEMPEFGVFYKENGEIEFTNWRDYDQDFVKSKRSKDNIIKDELREALRSTPEGASELLIRDSFSLNVWWLNADEQGWKYSENTIEHYPIKTLTKTDKLRTRNYFNQLAVGDLFIAYQKAPTKKLFGVYLMVPSLLEGHYAFTLLHEFPDKLSWVELLKISEFLDSVVKSMSAQGSAYNLELSLFITILKKTTDLHHFAESLPMMIAEKAKLFPEYSFKHPYIDRNIDLELDKDSNERDQTLNVKDKIQFQLDFVEKIDRLNREPVAKSLARLINEDVFDKEQRHSFMIHLQGSWGAGKSTFLNLLEEHLETKKRNWVVVKYNAWQNQHISPPWWSFIDQIYLQSKRKMSWRSRLWFTCREKSRRVVKYGRWQKGLLFGLCLLFLGLFILYGKSLLQLAFDFPSGEAHDSKTNGISLEFFAKLITSVAAAIGAIYSFSKFIATPLLMKNSSEAKSFVQHVSDPMETIKTHFENLISNINESGFEVAVFIDDLDRCDRKYTIELLEGIQTLFKEKRVLYVVAGDKDWIATCFEKNYAEFVNVAGKNKKLGELFLEKAFQLSIRLPQMSDSSKKKYWDFILGNKLQEKVKLSDDVREKIKGKMKTMDIIGNKNGTSQLDLFETEFNATEAEISDVMLELLDENQADVKHLLAEHHELIEPNPRAIIRLANEYTMFRNILWTERIQFNSNVLFRWIILESSYPFIASRITENLSILNQPDSFEKLIAEIDEKEKFEKLFFDREGKHGGEMEMDQLADILGISLDGK